ncbi:MAG: metal ABC transporter ATP-binding protein [Planctomycetota bacterium]
MIAPTDEPALAFENVRFAYPGGREVLRGIDVRVGAGEVLAVIGPNGGGKTTLLKLVLGLESPSAGTVRVLGGEPGDARRSGRIGYVSQLQSSGDGALRRFPVSSRQLVELGIEARRFGFAGIAKETRERAHRALELVGATRLADRCVGSLSGGERQRVLIARAIASEPEILALDEPTVGVDVAGQAAFAELLRTINESLNVTILLVSHDVRAIAAGADVCDRVMCLRETVHFHDAPRGLTPDILAHLFEHELAGVFGGVHMHALDGERADCEDRHDETTGGD